MLKRCSKALDVVEDHKCVYLQTSDCVVCFYLTVQATSRAMLIYSNHGATGSIEPQVLISVECSLLSWLIYAE